MDRSKLVILVPIDFSDCSRRALDHAIGWLVRTPGAIHVVHVIDDFAGGDSQSLTGELTRALGALEHDIDTELARVASAADSVPVSIEHHIVAGEPSAEILKLATRIGAGLIVMGTHGRSGLRHLLLGSVAEQVVRGASCPVVCVKAEATDPRLAPCRRILCPVDFSDTSHDAMLAAAGLAGRLGVELRLLHVYQAPVNVSPEGFICGPDLIGDIAEAAEQTLAVWKQQAEAAGASRVLTVCQMGWPPAEIVAQARELACDLIVMGTHGRTGLAHLFMGSVAERVIRTTSLPVLTVHLARSVAVHDAGQPAA